MQAMQCVQLPPQRGLPPDNVMFFRGQSLTHAPQPVHFSPAINALSLTNYG